MINDYNSSGEKHVIKNNFFEKIKPIVKSLKNNPKFKKPLMKDEATSMDCNMTILTDFDKYESLDPTMAPASNKKVSKICLII